MQLMFIQTNYVPPNKRYDLMDANKEVDLEHVQCPPESKILTNIIKNHPLRFSIAASSSVPWIYMAQFWHTLKEDGSKYRLMFMLDKKEISLTLDDFRTIFHLPQANTDNHDSFVTPPSFLDMVPFFKQQLGFTMEQKTSSSFKTTGLLQPWQTLCNIFSKCLITRVTRWDQPSLQIMQIMKIQRQSWNANSRLDDFRRNEAHGALSDVCGGVWVRCSSDSVTATHKTLSAPRRSTRLTPPAPVPTINKADEMILQDTLQIKKMVEGSENVIDDSLLPRNDESKIPGTRLEPRSDKESPEVEITNDEEVEITNVVILVNVNEEEEEITDEVYELKRREKGKIVEESMSTPFPTPIRSPRIHTNLVSLDTEKLQELTQGFYQGSHLILLLSMKADPQLQQKDIAIWLALQMKFESLQVPQTTCRSYAVRLRDQDDPHDDAHPEGENRAKRQKTSEYEAYVSGESSSGHVNENEQGSSTLRNQEQEDDYNFWTESYASDDDEIPTKQMSQDIIEEVSLIIDEAKLKKMVDEMLRQRCTSGAMLKVSVRSVAPPLSLINQDLLYLKKGSSGPEKIVLPFHKFPAIIFNDDDIEDRTSRWVNKHVKKFNPYARYGVEHWKNPHAMIFYIRK
ncbi:hypothetical protein Tco_0439574 [Tanacetum coccineum]